MEKLDAVTEVVGSAEQKPTISIYSLLGIVGVSVVLVGFIPTYFYPLFFESKEFPIILHVHGLFAFLWVILFLCQSTFVQSRKVKLHKTFGVLGLFIAIGVFTTMQMASAEVFGNKLDGGELYAHPSFLGPIIDSFVFISFVIIGLANRKSSDFHKRLMLLATIYLLWVAWSRLRHYFPAFPGSEEFFAFVLPNSLIVLVWIREKMIQGSIHPAMLYGGIIAIMIPVVQMAMYDGDVWNAIANLVFRVMPY